MRNAVSINKARTLMVGKIASLAVLATCAMIFATPLISLANPSMCGLPNLNATFQKAIIGFTLNADQTYTFIPAPKDTPLMLGSYIEVKIDDDGRLMPATIRSISGSAPKLKVKGFLDPRVSEDAATVSISGVTEADSTDIDTSINAAVVQPIASFALNPDSTFTFVPAPKDTVVMPGSWIEVTTADGKNLPATIASKISKDKKDPTKSNATAYVAALNKTQAAKLTISLTEEQSTGSWG